MQPEYNSSSLKCTLSSWKRGGQCSIPCSQLGLLPERRRKTARTCRLRQKVPQRSTSPTLGSQSHQLVSIACFFFFYDVHFLKYFIYVAAPCFSYQNLWTSLCRARSSPQTRDWTRTDPLHWELRVLTSGPPGKSGAHVLDYYVVLKDFKYL